MLLTPCHVPATHMGLFGSAPAKYVADANLSGLYKAGRPQMGVSIQPKLQRLVPLPSQAQATQWPTLTLPQKALVPLSLPLMDPASAGSAGSQGGANVLCVTFTALLGQRHKSRAISFSGLHLKLQGGRHRGKQDAGFVGALI